MKYFYMICVLALCSCNTNNNASNSNSNVIGVNDLIDTYSSRMKPVSVRVSGCLEQTFQVKNDEKKGFIIKNCGEVTGNNIVSLIFRKGEKPLDYSPNDVVEVIGTFFSDNSDEPKVFTIENAVINRSGLDLGSKGSESEPSPRNSLNE